MKWIYKITSLLLIMSSMVFGMELDQPKFELYSKAEQPVWFSIADKDGKQIPLETGTLYRRERRILGHHKDVQVPDFAERIFETEATFVNEKGNHVTRKFQYIELRENEKYRHNDPIGMLAITARQDHERFTETVPFYEVNPGAFEKDVYLTYEIDRGLPTLISQIGPLSGMKGVSDSGFSLANNIQMRVEHGDIATYFNTNEIMMVPYGIRDFRPFGELEYHDKFYYFLATGKLFGEYDVRVAESRTPVIKTWDEMGKAEKHRAVVAFFNQNKRHLENSYNGFYPIHIATWFGHYFTVKQLVNVGSSLDLRDINYMTASEIAAQQTRRMNQRKIQTPYATAIRKLNQAFTSGFNK